MSQTYNLTWVKFKKTLKYWSKYHHPSHSGGVKSSLSALWVSFVVYTSSCQSINMFSPFTLLTCAHLYVIMLVLGYSLTSNIVYKSIAITFSKVLLIISKINIHACVYLHTCVSACVSACVSVCACVCRHSSEAKAKRMAVILLAVSWLLYFQLLKTEIKSKTFKFLPP